MANPNWTRWIHSSIAVYLKSVATSLSLPTLIEGIDDRSEAFMSAPNRLEVRVNGPFTQEISHGYHRVYVDVNVVLKCHLGGELVNAFTFDQLLGELHEAMDGPIPVLAFSLVPAENDDPEHVACLVPRSGKNDAIRVIHFGQIDRTDRIREGMVDARYTAYIAS